MKKFAWIVALIASAGIALAEDAAPAQKQDMMFEKWDANKDGKVTPEEFQAYVDKINERVFGRLDRNSDGFIDKDELPPSRPYFRDLADISEMDKDGNGKVTKEEFIAGNKDRYKEYSSRMDKNGDGVITKDEQKAGGVPFGSHRGPPQGEGTKPADGEKKDAK